jgi:SAM-dependent methyltransferase
MTRTPVTDARFDAAYYQRFYRDPKTRVVTPEERARQMALIIAVLKYQEVEVRSILDAGCGLGLARKPLLRAFPEATYTGLEVSEYLCEKYGWVHSSVVEFRSRRRFDFVLCSDVMQYFDDRAAAQAIERLAQLCRGMLWLHVPTREDLVDNIDADFSDTNVHFRPAEWYRRHLRRHFHHLGFGLHMKKTGEPLMWELAKPR